MKKFKVDTSIDLKTFLADKLNLSKAKAKEIIDLKLILVNNKRVWIAKYKLKKGDIVEVPEFESIKIDKNFDISKSILYEDDFIIAVNKPPFLESNLKKGSVEDILRRFKRDKKIEAIHRLDKETSGVLLFAKNKKTFFKFKELWEEKKVNKLYLAIVVGIPKFKKKFISIPIDKKYAKSEVFVKNIGKNSALVEVNIRTGRKHQIRIHLAKIGYPIIGDKIYGYKNVDNPILKSVKRQMLHSSKISFTHPFLKKNLTITAPLHKDFLSLKKLLEI